MYSYYSVGDPQFSTAVRRSSLETLFLAAVIPFLFLKLCSFFNHTWPNLVYRLLTSRLERQIATVAERVYPNRIIQDDIMIRTIMGYVSYCYLESLRKVPNACDAVSLADYDYSFIYENVKDFDDSWVPYSTHYKSLFGRVIASAMELSVVPSIGQAIQVEPGLFVRSLENKHVYDAKKDNEEGCKNVEKSKASHRSQGSTRLNQMDKLNQYVFYDMRKFAENMDEHTKPAVDGNADDVSSVERPFDPLVGKRRDKKGHPNGDKSESTCCDNKANPPQENFIVIEYRRPLPYEMSQALCNAHNTAGVAAAYDATRAAEDAIEGFLGRAHCWYLAHVAQCKMKPLMMIYPTPAAVLFAKKGARGLIARHAGEGDFTGRCYVLDTALPATDAGTSEHVCSFSSAAGSARAEVGRGNMSEEEEHSAGRIAGAAVAIGPSTLAGAHIGFNAASNRSLQPMGKTFRSLFFPAKARVLSIIDDFVHERGCYGVPGVVARLNFFLHGAPGTGKTSFVKALARYLHRNIVIVSMSEILTVDELRRLLQPFELKHKVDSSDEDHFSVRPHQSIYVFEDFDAIGDAWTALQRDQCERTLIKEQQKKEVVAVKAAKAAVGVDEESETEEEDSVDAGPEACEKEEWQSSGGDSGSGDWGNDSCDDDSNSSSAAAAKINKFLLSEKRMEELERTHLTVERFLDLFNGFDLPDSFIAIFTTNHPEKVHPRITSSDMMDVTLDMGMLNEACALEMVEYYFADELAAETADTHGRRHLTPAQAAALRAALEAFNKISDGLSGALLEKMCMECDSVELLTQRLRAADTWDTINAF